MRKQRNNAEITPELLQNYLGGQFEWFDFIDGSLRYAGINGIEIRDNTIWLHFFWAVDEESDEIKLETSVSQVFTFSIFPIQLENPTRSLKLKAQDRTIYDVLEFIDKPGAYRYRLYPPGKLGLDTSKLEGFKMPD